MIVQNTDIRFDVPRPIDDLAPNECVRNQLCRAGISTIVNNLLSIIVQKCVSGKSRKNRTGNTAIVPDGRALLEVGSVV